MTNGSPVGSAAAPPVDPLAAEPLVAPGPLAVAPGAVPTAPGPALELPPGRAPAAPGVTPPGVVVPGTPGCPTDAPATPPRLAATIASWLIRVPQAAENSATPAATPAHASRRRDRRTGSPECMSLLKMSALGGIYIFKRIGRS